MGSSAVSDTVPGSGAAAVFTLADLAGGGVSTPAGGALGGVASAAVARAGELGLPTVRDEEWRYTNPLRVVEGPYTLPREAVDAGWSGMEEPRLDGVGGVRLVFVDGRFSAGLSELGGLPDGLEIAVLGDDGDGGVVDAARDVLSEGVSSARDGFEALGAGLTSGGVVVRVASGVKLGQPIVVRFLTRGLGSGGEGGAGLLTSPTVVILAGEGSECTVVEDHQSPEGACGLSLGRGEIRASSGAVVKHLMIERESSGRHFVSTLRVRQDGESVVRSHRMLLGGAVVRNNIHSTIEGEGADAEFNGLFVPDGSQHHDTHIRIEHMEPGCTSRQYYRGLLSDTSRGVFTGRIYVRDEAQKTDAIQSNSNLLLSPRAQVTAKPQLEIYADDVRCTHGATSGMFDEDALFYLMSRGIDRKTSRLLLLHAFAGENIDRILDGELRELVRGLVFGKLDAALDRVDSSSP